MRLLRLKRWCVACLVLTLSACATKTQIDPPTDDPNQFDGYYFGDVEPVSTNGADCDPKTTTILTVWKGRVIDKHSSLSGNVFDGHRPQLAMFYKRSTDSISIEGNFCSSTSPEDTCLEAETDWSDLPRQFVGAMTVTTNSGFPKYAETSHCTYELRLFRTNPAS